jgi:hypothetical protein
MDLQNSKYAEFLEEVLSGVVQLQPEKIGICMIAEDGTTMTGYFGDCCPTDKAVMAFNLQNDATMDTIMANAKMILEAAENGEGD